MYAVAQRGKAAGAYTNDEAYGVPPYVLTAFSGHCDSVSAIVHEWGHARHSRLAQSGQPFESGDSSGCC